MAFRTRHKLWRIWNTQVCTGRYFWYFLEISIIASQSSVRSQVEVNDPGMRLSTEKCPAQLASSVADANKNHDQSDGHQVRLDKPMLDLRH